MSCYNCDFGLQAIVDEQAAQAAQPIGSPSRPEPASQQAASQSQSSPAPASPAAVAAAAAAAAATMSPLATPTAAAAAAAVAAAATTPAAASPATTPVPASLLRHTQAANLLTGSPLAATPASRAQTGSSGRQAGAAPSADRRPAAAGMHASSQATQNTEVMLQVLMHSAVDGKTGDLAAGDLLKFSSSSSGFDASFACWCCL